MSRTFFIIALNLALPLAVSAANSAPAAVTFDTATIDGTPGYFQVGRSTQGHWWLLSPSGQPFLFKGVTSISRENTQDPSPATPGSYHPVVEANYGTDPARFRDATLQRLRDWDFNALGAWCGEEFWDQGMPYTIILDFTKTGPHLGDMDIPDVFDPAWMKAIETRAKTLCAPHQASRMLIGYFTDNEISWPGPVTIAQEHFPAASAPQTQPLLLQKCLSLPPDSPAAKASWDWIKARHHRSLSEIARAWGVKSAAPELIAQWTHAETALLAPGFLADNNAFVGFVSERYFRLSAEAIRKYDDHHLILGCRFGGPPSPAVLAACRLPWVDVISANNYRDTMYDRIDIYWQATHRPILISEFAWVSDYFTKQRLPNEPPGGLPPVERMLTKGRAALEQALTHPGLVGYTWYRWVDKPDQIPPISYGLVTAQDAPNWANLGVLTWINAHAEQMAAGTPSSP